MDICGWRFEIVKMDDRGYRFRRQMAGGCRNRSDQIRVFVVKQNDKESSKKNIIYDPPYVIDRVLFTV